MFSCYKLTYFIKVYKYAFSFKVIVTMASDTLLKIVFVGLFVTFLFILLTGVMAVKINNGDTCGFDKLISSSGISDVEYFTFVDNTTYVLVSVPEVNNENYVYYDFCVRGSANNNTILTVINELDVPVGTIYFPSGNHTFCTSLNSVSRYVGVSCSTCGVFVDHNHSFTIYQSIATNVPSDYIIIDFTDVNPDDVNPNSPNFISDLHYDFFVETNPLSYNLYGANSCKETVKLFNKYYLSVVGVLLLLFLIILGASSMHDNLIGVFGKEKDGDDDE